MYFRRVCGCFGYRRLLQWYEKLVAINPTNADAYYSIGFVAWSKWYPAYATARANLGMKEEDPGPIKRVQLDPQLGLGLGRIEEAARIAMAVGATLAHEYASTFPITAGVRRSAAQLSLAGVAVFSIGVAVLAICLSAGGRVETNPVQNL